MRGEQQEPVVVIETSMGSIKVELWPDKAPITVKNFLAYVDKGFYDGLIFHRVIDGFMAQGGDPTGTGTGGSDKPNLKAEFSDVPHKRGTASMARAMSPDSANSQFFICFEDCSFLDGQYTVWGEVVEGMDAVDKIKRGEPVQNPDRIEKMQVMADAS